jgi:hypothetical protein
MPDKLPITAFAGIIAAAVQATGAVSGFFAAVTWSLVILAAAVEAALCYTAAKRSWPPLRKVLTAGVAIAVAILVVSLLNLHAYRIEFLNDDVRVNFQVPHPNQLGTSELALNFLILNKAPSSILLEETVAAVIASTDFSNNTFRDSAYCKLVPGWLTGRKLTENWLHPGQTVLHNSSAKPAHFLEEANENWTTDPPFADDGKLDMAFYDPKSIMVDGREFPSGPMGIEPGKPLGISATFVTDPAQWGAHNVLTLCGAIRYLSSDGRDTWAVCPAQIFGWMFQNGQPAGQTGGPFASTPFMLGRNSNDSRCGIWSGM